MKPPIISRRCCRPMPERFLVRILLRCGRYYQSGTLFYQRLWYQRLTQVGFRVTSVEKLPYHHLWDIRLYGTLTSQSYLLLTKPLSKEHGSFGDLLAKQFLCEIQSIAQDLGERIRRDCIHVAHSGAYFRISFIWPSGRPGRWVKPEKKAEAFSFLIRPWLRRNRN